MDSKLLAENIIKQALKAGADEAEVYIENNRDFSLSVLNGNVESINQSTSKGLGLTVFKEKKLGFAYTSDFSPDFIAALPKKTVQLCLVGDARPWNGLPDFKPGIPANLDLYDSTVAQFPIDEKIKIAREVEKIALAADKRITKSDGGNFVDNEIEIIIVNSKGISRAAKETSIGFSVGVIAGEGNDMQAGSWGSTKRYFTDLDRVESVAQEAAKRAYERLGARPVESQRAPVIFDHYTCGRFWYGIIGAVYGESVYKKTTFLTDYLDKPIAAKSITMIDDPTIPRHIESHTFDGEGKITRRNILIDKGVLKMFIYSTIDARKAGVNVPTITNRDGYRSTAFAGTLNIIVQNGNVDLKAMISGVKNGFYVTGLRGSGVDRTTGNYSCGASGFWIKDGEIAFPVDGVTLGGNVLGILGNIELVANDLDLRGSINSPSFKVTEMTIGGK